jgi:ankyrin repeat protein
MGTPGPDPLRACPCHLAYAADAHGRTPLHATLQFRRGRGEGDTDKVIETLLRTAPGTALVRDVGGNAPLHYAAAGHASRRAVLMIVHVAPTTLMQPNRAGKTPLDLALESGHAHADCFVSGQDHVRCLTSLLKTKLGRTLVPHFLRVSQPVPPQCWDMLPSNLPGLARAIPEVLTRGTRADFGRLAKLLNADERHLLGLLREVLGPGARGMQLGLVRYLTDLVFDFDESVGDAPEAFDLPVCHFQREELAN